MKKKNKLLPVIIGLVVIALVAAGVLGVCIYQKLQEGPVEVVYEAREETSTAIKWEGADYQYNDHLSNYLFIGVDEYELSDSTTGQMEAGQCDALYLVSYDRVTKDMAIISIPRDTMTRIETFLPDGSTAGKTTDHISLSFSFGDGKHESCRLTKEAVSNLFYGLDITGYCAMSMSGLPVIPEVIGEFDVVVPNNSLEVKDPMYQEGSTVTITGENAETFVRFRDIETSQSALYRQERQKAFLEAALDTVEGQFKQNAGIVTDLYEALTPYMVTSMSNDIFLELVESAYSGEIVSWTVPGEGVATEEYDEYHVDDELLYEKIIETFYKKVE